MALAAIALGSNLPGRAGTREANLNGAVHELASLGEVLARSHWYETEPVGYTGQPTFLNGAVLLDTLLDPRALLEALLGIELAFGRDRSHGIAKGPRTLDLDLLLYGDLILEEPELAIPHPEMQSRRFVLEPLAEIAPHWMHPVLRKTVQDLLAGVS